MYCPYCGLKNDDGAIRCAKCGGEIPIPVLQRKPRLPYIPGPGLGCIIGLAAIGILSLAIIVPQYLLYQRQVALARESLVRNNMRMLRTVMEQYAAEYGQYPIDFEPRNTGPGESNLREIQMTLSRMQNPIDPAQTPITVSRAYPPDWRTVKPGQVVYVPRDTSNGWARSFLLFGMGKKQPLPDTMRSGLY
jgi:type II secretory pathway pseudopilin PulG